MKTKRPTRKGVPCFECADGILVPVLRDYVTTLPGHGEITIPDVPMESCDHCGETVIGDAGNTLIDARIATGSPGRSPRRRGSASSTATG